MIKVSNVVDVKEVNGKEPPVGEGPMICVNSHRNATGAVVLVISPGETEYTVLASDIEAAIANARNSNRHGL